MSNTFRFREFTIEQTINAQKVGTDSMLLGAWSSGRFSRILDIGTGTGILALMMAQQNPDAEIVAIEPDMDFLAEAKTNFDRSPFANRITAVPATLQAYRSPGKFDLIIANPPYFENSFRSQDTGRTKARHTGDLPIPELYAAVGALLAPAGYFNLIFPYDLENFHLAEARRNNLFPVSVLRTLRPDNTRKRTLVSFTSSVRPLLEGELMVKNDRNQYTAEYIRLTRPFYGKDLESIQPG